MTNKKWRWKWINYRRGKAIHKFLSHGNIKMFIKLKMVVHWHYWCSDQRLFNPHIWWIWLKIHIHFSRLSFFCLLLLIREYANLLIIKLRFLLIILLLWIVYFFENINMWRYTEKVIYVYKYSVFHSRICLLFFRNAISGKSSNRIRIQFRIGEQTAVFDAIKPWAAFGEQGNIVVTANWRCIIVNTTDAPWRCNRFDNECKIIRCDSDFVLESNMGSKET